MQRHFRKSLWLVVAALVTLSLTLGTVLAHEGRPVGDYRFVVGWLEEPAYEGARNAVSVTITKAVEEGGEGENSDSEGGEDSSEHGEGGDRSSQITYVPKVLPALPTQHQEETVSVDGLEGAIQAEVTHIASGASTTRELLAVFGEPGHYVAPLIPTATGVYEFRVFGTIEGTTIDKTFVSRGGGGGFDDIRSSTGLHFPEELPELREIESGLRGALLTAQEAQDTALAAQEQSGGSTLAIVALVVGIIGVIFGIGGIFFGLRARQT